MASFAFALVMMFAVVAGSAMAQAPGAAPTAAPTKAPVAAPPTHHAPAPSTKPAAPTPAHTVAPPTGSPVSSPPAPPTAASGPSPSPIATPPSSISAPNAGPGSAPSAAGLNRVHVFGSAAFVVVAAASLLL